MGVWCVLRVAMWGFRVMVWGCGVLRVMMWGTGGLG